MVHACRPSTSSSFDGQKKRFRQFPIIFTNQDSEIRVLVLLNHAVLPF